MANQQIKRLLRRRPEPDEAEFELLQSKVLARLRGVREGSDGATEPEPADVAGTAQIEDDEMTALAPIDELATSGHLLSRGVNAYELPENVVGVMAEPSNGAWEADLAPISRPLPEREDATASDGAVAGFEASEGTNDGPVSLAEAPPAHRSDKAKPMPVDEPEPAILEDDLVAGAISIAESGPAVTATEPASPQPIVVTPRRRMPKPTKTTETPQTAKAGPRHRTTAPKAIAHEPETLEPRAEMNAPEAMTAEPEMIAPEAIAPEPDATVPELDAPEPEASATEPQAPEPVAAADPLIVPPPRAARPARRRPAVSVVPRERIAAATQAAIAPYCPYCALLLDPPPEANTRCARCRERIIVKRVDGRTIYLTEASVRVFEAEQRRMANAPRWTRERQRWLKVAASVGAPAERIAKLEAAPVSEVLVGAAHALYSTTVDRSFRTAKRERHWDAASRIMREHAQVLFKIAGAPMPPPDESIRAHQQAAMAALHGIAEMAREAELVGARCCDICSADHGRTFRIASELRSPRVPHAGCPKGLCRCEWYLAVRDQTMVRRHLRRRARADAPSSGGGV